MIYQVEEMWKLKELAKFLGVGRGTLYRWVKNGKLKTIKVGGSYRVPTREVDKITAEGIKTLKNDNEKGEQQ